MSSEQPMVVEEGTDLEGHPHQKIVICRGFDDPDDVLIYGPFEDDAWAQAWITQHNHDYMMEDGKELPDEEQDRRIQDEDHYCNFSPDVTHSVSGMWTPGFDPTTVPAQE